MSNNEQTSVEPADLNDAALRHRAVDAAQGRAAFDMLISGATIVDVVTGQLRDADIGIVGPLIASVHTPGAFERADDCIDARGKCVSPGLIDTHLHIESSMITPEAYAREVLPRGVTTVIWDPHEFANTCGTAGMAYALDSTRNLPLRVLTLAPSSVPSAPGYENTGADFSPDVLARLLSDPAIAGVGEMMSMQAVLDLDPRFSGIVQHGLASGKRVCGHARGLNGASLNAYVAAGIETDHELISGDDLLAKLQAGLTIEMRGSHDHLLPEFVETLNALQFFPQTITLCTDDVFIDDLLEKGGLDDVVRRLVRYGLDPLKAFQAATINAAVRIRRPDLGLVAPGKRADLLVLDDLETVSVTHTIANGVCVAKEKILQCPLDPVTIPAQLLKTVRASSYQPDDFRVAATGSSADVVVIEKPRFTQWAQRSLSVKDGFVERSADLTLMAVINRYGEDATPRVAFLGEWGQWRGALATTVSHDSHNLTLFGGSEEDLAAAANSVIEMGGGLAVARHGKIIARLALPVAGLVSQATATDIASDFQQVRNAMDKVVDWQPPLLVFKACFGASLVCNPGPRLSDVGIVDTALGHKQPNPLGQAPH